MCDVDFAGGGDLQVSILRFFPKLPSRAPQPLPQKCKISRTYRFQLKVAETGVAETGVAETGVAETGE